MRFQLLFLFAFSVACNSDEGITKFNSIPEANILSHEDLSELTEGEVVLFHGTVTDANNDADQLTAEWLSGTEVICPAAPPQTDGTTSCERQLVTTDTEIILIVKDPENASNDDRINLTIVPTDAPQAEILAPTSTGKYYADHLITFEGLVSDTEDTPQQLTVNWESNLDGTLESVDGNPDTDGKVLGHGYLSEGEHAVELHVEDSSGKQGSTSINIQVGPANTAPLCQITAPPDLGSSVFGTLILFTGTVEDPDIAPAELNVKWSSDKDGDLGTSIPDSDGTLTFGYSDLTVDTHTVTLTVTDEVGATCTTSIVHTVGTPPTIAITSPNDGEIFSEGEAILFSATVSDNEEIASSLSLQWERNGVLFATQSADGNGMAQFSASDIEAGTHSLVVRATDGDGLTAEDIIAFTVNALPTAPSISINPDPAYTDNTITAAATGSTDADGQIVSYGYEWSQGSLQIAGSTLASSYTSKGEVWTMTVTPNDGISDGPSSTASVTISNSAPTISTISITPSNGVTTQSLLTCTATATDPDEVPTLSYQWTDQTGSVISTSNTLQLSAQTVGPGDQIQCQAIATDSDNATDSDTATVNVENSLPEVTDLHLDPLGAKTNDTITASTSTIDADGQTVSVNYEWHVIDFATGIDSTVQTGSNTTLSGITEFDRDDEVYVIATPFDGIDYGLAVTSTAITIENSSPEIPTISITPTPATNSTDLVCSVDVASQDDDGDTITYSYEWKDATGSSFQTTLYSGSSDTLAATITSEGEWSCEVTPHDGTDNGPTATALTTVIQQCTSLQFDGTNYVEVADAAGLDLLFSEYTIEAWVQPTDIGFLPCPYQGAAHSVVYKRGQQGYYLDIRNCSNGSPTFRYNSDNSGNDFIGTTQISTNQWYHLAITYSGGIATMWINGVEEGSQTIGPTIDTSHPLRIGHDTHNYQYPWKGYIREVRLSSVSRYATTFSPALALQSDSDTIALWNMNEGTGTTIYDASGNGNHGTVNGAANWISVCPDTDADGDGYAIPEDCDDNNPLIYPLAGDTYGDNIDSDCDNFDCEADFDGNGNYFSVCLETTQLSFTEAQTNCQSGGHDRLALPQSSSENDFVFNLSKSIWTQSSYNYSIRIGGTDADNEGVWLDEITGTPMSYFNWAGSEPTNSFGDEHCINIIGDVSYNGLWQDLACYAPSNAAFAWSCESR